MIDCAPPSVLRQFVERARALYSLPSVAVRVLELTSGPNVDVPALKECLERDPALVAKVLRAVNSSLFSPSRKISDLNQALALLGVKPLKLLVLGFSLPKELWSGLEAQTLARYWRRSLVKAVAARELAERAWLIPGDEAFIAGLLQDVGVLVLIQDLGDTYVRFLDRVHNEKENLEAIETSTLGFDHGVLSARLLAHWALPESLARAVGLSRRTERLLALRPDEQALPQTLHLAELAAALLVDERPGALAELHEAGRLYRSLTPEHLAAVLESLEGKVAELACVLSLDLPAGRSFGDVISKAHAQLAEAAAEAAPVLLRGEHETAEAALWKETQSLAATLAGAMHPTEHAAPNRDERFEPIHSRASVSTFPDLAGRLATSIAACRAARRSCSLLLVELDQYADLVLGHSPAGAARLAKRLESLVGTLCEPDDERLFLGDGRLAVLLAGRDRSGAAQFGREIVRRWGAEIGRVSSAAGSITLSVGLATLALPSKNFPPQALIDAAERCLSAAQQCGGDAQKSIEL